MTDKELRIIKTCIMSGAEKLRRTNPHKSGIAAHSAWNNACLNIDRLINAYLCEYMEDGLLMVYKNENV